METHIQNAEFNRNAVKGEGYYANERKLMKGHQNERTNVHNVICTNVHAELKLMKM